jgi:hypothetical protein
MLEGRNGIDYVRCRICGEHRRVISRRHLSKHDTDRQSYLERYGLSPDELIVKDFRQIQTSRPGYHPYSKGEWIEAVKRVYEIEGKSPLSICNAATWRFISKRFGFSAMG